jgi:hypothetical protein
MVAKLLRLLSIGAYACFPTYGRFLNWYQIDSFTEKYFQFVDGVPRGHRNVDQLLGQVSTHPSLVPCCAMLKLLIRRSTRCSSMPSRERTNVDSL